MVPRGKGKGYVLRKKMGILLVVIAIGTVGLLAVNIDSIYLSTKPNFFVGFPERLISGYENSFIVKAFAPDGKPLPNKVVEIEIIGPSGEKVYWSGKTDEEGVLIPKISPGQICGRGEIVVRSEGYSVSKPIIVDSNIRLLITTDKPIYRPGDMMHVRILAFKGYLPLAQSVVAEIRDPDGNKIYRKELAPDKYGIASFDFPFSPVLPLGEYNVSVICGKVSQQKVVLVKKYVLPKFAIEFQDVKDWYLIGEAIEGSIKCRYFFGKEVRGSATITASVYAGEWIPVPVYPSTGSLSSGYFSFKTANISYAVGLPVNAYNGYLVLNATVIDEAGHMEVKSRVITIGKNAIEVSVLSTAALDDIETPIYVLAKYPDGTPVENAYVTLRGTALGTLDVNRTDERGVAKLRFTPKSLTGKESLYVEVTKEKLAGSAVFGVTKNLIKVIPSREKYRVGDEAKFKVFYRGNSMTDEVYYDVVVSGFVVSNGIAKLKGGIAEFSLHISSDYAPYAQVRVYKIEANLSVVRDVTFITVEGDKELNVGITPDKEVYLPKENANITFSVRHGTPVKAVLGVKIVDKSVYELEERFTGIDKLYFQLEEELTTPAYMLAEYIFGARQTETGPVTASMTNTVHPGSVVNLAEVNKEKAWRLKNSALEVYFGVLVVLGSAGLGGMLCYIYIAKPDSLAGMSLSLLGENTIWLIILMLISAVVLGGVLSSMSMQMLSGPGIAGVDKGGGVMGPPTPGPEPAGFSTDGGGLTYTQSPGVKPVRQFFPETWYWNPLIETGENGTATVNLLVPDSITSWEIEAVASTPNCRIGVGWKTITVFQDFFIEPDIPCSLTRNDTISLRVMVYNYKNETLDVTVNLRRESWFQLYSNSTQTIQLPPNSVSSLYFEIRALKVGVHKLFVSAEGASIWDAVLRDVEVVPDGRIVSKIINGRIENNGSKEHVINFSAERIENSERLFAKLQTGIEAVVIDGAEEYIHFVSGCGEQSMSTLSIDILAYRAAKKSLQSTGKLFEYEMMVTQGIQHELQYLVKAKNGIGRGIVWFPGDEDVHPWLTSWGLITFQDAINAGFTIDDAIISDMQEWLFSQQKSDGSFVFPEWGLYEYTHPILKSKTVACTAYVTRALMYSGISAEDERIQRALSYIAENVEAEKDDAYTLALCTLTLAMGNWNSNFVSRLGDRIYELRKVENDAVYWNSNSTLLSHASPYPYHTISPRTIETTGYAVMALHAIGKYRDAISGGVKFLLQNRQRHGYFSTQDTVVAFQALFTAGETKVSSLNVALWVNGTRVFEVQYTKENADITYYVDLKEYVRDTLSIQIVTSGNGVLNYQIIKEEYLPYQEEEEALLKLSVSYNTTNIHVNDMVLVTLTVNYTLDSPMKMLLIDFRAPAGFGFVESDFQNLTAAKKISRYEINGRISYLYIQNLPPGARISLTFRIVALYPLKALAHGTRAFDMYMPEICAEAKPEMFYVS
ncbi:MAG: alpha-2-macroglobulin family protein [Thermoplasmata archaeon]